MQHIGIIGAGNMGKALGKGLQSGKPEGSCGFFDIDPAIAKMAAEICGGAWYSDMEELYRKAEIIVIAVKPQHLKDLWLQLPENAADKKYISIVAGKPISLFEEALGTDQVIRFMPNLAAKVSSSVVAISFGERTDDTFRSRSRDIASAIGHPIELPEHLLAAFTGLSGSGIAYVFAFLHAMALGGTDAGIPYGKSLEIAYGTVEGAVKLLREEGVKPTEYLTRVTSAGGTTIKGVKALEEGRFTATVMNAVEAAAQKAEAFEKG